jgi:hypothetical protein
LYYSGRASICSKTIPTMSLDVRLLKFNKLLFYGCFIGIQSMGFIKLVVYPLCDCMILRKVEIGPFTVSLLSKAVAEIT